jgi:hypothetical protein
LSLGGFLVLGSLCLLGFLTLQAVSLGLKASRRGIVPPNGGDQIPARALLDLLRLLLVEPIEVLNLGGDSPLGVGGNKLSGRARRNAATD